MKDTGPNKDDFEDIIHNFNKKVKTNSNSELLVKCDNVLNPLSSNYILTLANLGDCEVGLISQPMDVMTGRMLCNPHTTNNKHERE